MPTETEQRFSRTGHSSQRDIDDLLAELGYHQPTRREEAPPPPPRESAPEPVEGKGTEKAGAGAQAEADPSHPGAGRPAAAGYSHLAATAPGERAGTPEAPHQAAGTGAAEKAAKCPG